MPDHTELTGALPLARRVASRGAVQRRLSGCSGARKRRLATAAAVLAGLAAPACALASGAPTTGGSGLSGGSGGTITAPTPSPVVQVVKVPVQVTGDGFTLKTSATAVSTRRLVIKGSAPTADIGQSIEIESRPVASTGAWKRVGEATIGALGAFGLSWKVNRTGHVDLRGLLARGTGPSYTRDGVGAPIASAAQAAAVTPDLEVTIFRAAVATIYGPGLWGHKTACGEKLKRATLGVASRTLKCGTPVGVYYDGREIVVTVIDRGPFAAGVKWDLTLATAKALQITQTATIGTLS